MSPHKKRKVSSSKEKKVTIPKGPTEMLVPSPAAQHAQLLYNDSNARSSLRCEDLLLTSVARAGLVETVAISATLWLERLLLDSVSEGDIVDWERLRETLIHRQQHNPNNPLLLAILQNNHLFPETIVVDKNQRKQLKAAKQQEDGESKIPPAQKKEAGGTMTATGKKKISSNPQVKAAQAAWKDSLPNEQHNDDEREPSQIIEDEEDYD